MSCASTMNIIDATVLDEEKKDRQYVSDSTSISDELDSKSEFDDGDDDDDVDAHLKSFPRSNLNSRRPRIRNDSYLSFLTRTERNANAVAEEENETLPPSLPSIGEVDSRRKVHFRDDDEFAIVHVIENVPTEDRDKVWLTNEDLERQEAEIELTCFRWRNHLNGSIPFDENNNSLRGIEHMCKVGGGGGDRSSGHLDQDAEDMSRTKWKHNRAVLEEMNRQRFSSDGMITDWDAIRKVSESFSADNLKRAVAIGKADEESYLRAWNPGKYSGIDDRSLNANKNDLKDKKKKKKRGFFSWRK